MAQELLPEIGDDNFNKLHSVIDKKITDVVDGHQQMPQESQNAKKHKYAHANVVDLHYIKKENFKTVLLNVGIDDYNGKTREEIIDLITEKSKSYINEDSSILR